MKLIIYDFDKTLITTCEQEEGREIYLQKTGNQFPHKTGWWSKPETLDTDIFDFKLNEYTHNFYQIDTKDENAYVYLVTGRMHKLKHHVTKIIDMFDLKFHDIFCSTGGETFDFKIKKFDELIEQHKPKHFVVYEDRHLDKFVEWSKKYDIKISIFDCLNQKQVI